MTTTRRSIVKGALVGALATAALIAPLFAMQPASANRRDGLEVSSTTPVSKSYPAIFSSASITSVRIPDPPECNTSAYCDTIPLKVSTPNIRREDEVVLEVSLEWKQFDANNRRNALQLFLFDDRQLKDQKPEPDESGYRADQGEYTVLAKATTGNPLTVRINTPDLGNYNVVVHNQDGNNQGYKVTSKLIIFEAEEVYEDVDEPRRPTTQFEDDEPAEPVFEADPDIGAGFEDDGTSEAAIDAPGDDLALDQLQVAADSELAGVLERNFEQELAQPTQVATQPIVEVPDPPSPLSVLLWLLVLPGGLAGGFAGWLMRKRAGFSFPEVAAPADTQS